MAKKNTGRAAQGAGTIRKKTVTRNGQQYTYWEARVTIGRDPGTGKQIQKSFSGKTQKEVREKMQAAAVAVNENTYSEPSKLSVSEWLDIWQSEFLGDVKPRTVDSYKATVKLHIKPALGAIKLQALSAVDIQKLYNKLSKQDKPLSPKSIKNLHGVLHKALQQAVELGYLKYNPADACKLPHIEKAEIKPLDDESIARFIEAVKGHKYENVYLTTLFTGMREGEVIGLTWDCVDFKNGTICINKQLQKERAGTGQYNFISTKSGRVRTITPAPFVMSVLKAQRRKQFEERCTAQDLWNNDKDLVFTNELGGNLSAQTVYLHFKKIVNQIGLPDARFHDLRHTFATVSLENGDSIKTVQENLGHSTAVTTLNIYSHVTDKMRTESASKMERFIVSLTG